ncbi:MAG: transposase [Planctomycetes bacterium]|nr:transposase [Planctomycetota bacterium]
MSREIKRRTRVATFFSNTESLLRLDASIVMDIGGDWETGRIYLNMDTE